MPPTKLETASVTDAAANGMLRFALQRSEPRRLDLLLFMLACALVVNLTRHFTGGKIMQDETFVLRLTLLGAMALYAITLRFFVQRANRDQRQVPLWIWLVSTTVEALFPTVAVFIVEVSGRVSPVEALTAPAILFYAIVIVLSILRMRPVLCAYCGALCALGHAGLLIWAAFAARAPIAPADWAPLISYSVYLAIAGAAATLVSFEVRKYFRSHLRETEARRKLDLVHREVEIARTVQQGLLPERPPNLPGYDIAGWNRPADRTGGDYYDWQELPDGRLAIVIADVSGHGLGPALIMAVCRAYARACFPIGPELRSTLGRINSLLHDDVQDGRFVTFAVVIIDSGSGRCELLSAGHGPTFLYRAQDHRIEEFDGDGIPLGVLADEVYQPPRQFTLTPGDALVLVTDGFIEWARCGDGELFGAHRLRDCLLQNAGAGATAMIEQLDRSVRAFGGDSPQMDDMTAVVIRRQPA